MLHEKIKYTDYDGNTVEEVFDFNLNKAELMKMELSTSGGIQTLVQTLIKNRDGKTIMETIEKLILMAYGEKSPDGKRFVKSAELSEAFKQTEAFSELYCKLCTNAEEAARFFNAVVPPEVAEEAAKHDAAEGLPNLTVITPPSEEADDGK